MEASNNPEVEVNDDEEYDTDDIDALLEELEWVDEDVYVEDEEDYDEESSDFSDDECLSPCVECGDHSVITIDNISLCDICYDGLYRDYD